MDLDIPTFEVEVETSLMRAVYLDSKTELSAQTKLLTGSLDRETAAKLLHLCCKFDSAKCAAAVLGGEVGEVPPENELNESGKSPLHTAAEAQAWRSVEVFLEKHARTDLKTKDAQAELAFELSLSDTCLDLNRSPIDDLVSHMSEKVLPLEDPGGFGYKTEMKETPLFFAVKNESKECAQLLLTWGADSKVLNLRRQRAIDLATSQDMRYILLNPITVSLINHAFPIRHKCTASGLTDEDTTVTTERNVSTSTNAEVCKYFDSHRGCVRGATCFYAHCEEGYQKLKEGDHSSLGYSKLSNFLKCFSNLCTIETLPICKGGTPTLVQLTRGADPEFFNLRSQASTTCNVDSSSRGEIHKYFDSHPGCAGGPLCFYADCEEVSQKGAMGTTTIAMFCEEGVLTSWDSRTCSDEYIRNDNTPDKMFRLNNNQICVTAGDVDALKEMEKSVLRKIQKRLNKQKPLSVIDSASYVFKELVGKANTECMIIGYNEELKMFEIWHAHAFSPVALTLVDKYQACGSGKSFIQRSLKSFYQTNISLSSAIDVHVCCIIEAGFFDPGTGGLIKVYYLVKDECRLVYCQDGLAAYSEYYGFMGHLTVLFMFVPRGSHPLFVSQYEAFFRKKFNVQILAAHAVAIKKHFSFHRIVLSSEFDLQKIYAQVKNIGSLKKRLSVVNPNENPYISRFKNGFFYDPETRRHPLYIEKSSLELLDEIRSMD